MFRKYMRYLEQISVKSVDLSVILFRFSMVQGCYNVQSIKCNILSSSIYVLYKHV